MKRNSLAGTFHFRSIAVDSFVQQYWPKEYRHDLIYFVGDFQEGIGWQVHADDEKNCRVIGILPPGLAAADRSDGTGQRIVGQAIWERIDRLNQVKYELEEKLDDVNEQIDAILTGNDDTARVRGESA